MTQMADVFDLPEDHILRVAHRASIYHRHAIEQSRQCGCFYCLKLFGPDQIGQWTDRHNHTPSTRLCAPIAASTASSATARASMSLRRSWRT
jgi:hypothetical protein